MIEEVNEKLHLEGEDKITTFIDLWTIVDIYYAASYDQKLLNLTLSKNFEDHMLDVSKLGIFEVLFSDEEGLKIANHNFFSLVYLLFSHKMKMRTEIKDTLATITVPKDKKYYLLFGHETTLASYL